MPRNQARLPKLRTLFFSAVMGLMLLPGSPAYSATDSFNLGWLELLRQEAVSKGVSEQTVERLLPNTLQPLATVVRQAHNQPEVRDTLADYLRRRVTPYRVTHGHLLMEQNEALLRRMEREYHVPPQLIMSIWAMETSFGHYTGNVNVIRALVTLARNRPDYRTEVIDALLMVDHGYTEIETEPGSWAGAFGQTQFIPSSFLRLAVDGDGDGRKDIWHDLADIFASTANHMHESGWKQGERWGEAVRLPPHFDRHLLTDRKSERAGKSKTLRQWAALGVRLPGGGALPLDYDRPVTLIAPNYNPRRDRVVRGPVYVVYDNFWAVMNYNSSYKYSLAVNMLADAIKRGPENRP